MKESRSLEFKQDLNSNYLKTVSAFSNFGGGTILFGVDDEGNSVGVSDPDHASMDLENRINDSIHPKPDYSISVNRRTNVISLTVSEGRSAFGRWTTSGETTPASAAVRFLDVSMDGRTGIVSSIAPL